MAKSDVLFQTKTDKKRTLLGCTYLYSSYKGAHRPYKVSASEAGSIETARNVSYHFSIQLVLDLECGGLWFKFSFLAQV